tara:strand:- start:1518 stop:1727 length:210 start_codon:yes stop_codon:yes gene_type:complete
MVAKAWGISKFVADVASCHHQVDLSKREVVDDADSNNLIDIVILTKLIVQGSNLVTADTTKWKILQIIS